MYIINLVIVISMKVTNMTFLLAYLRHTMDTNALKNLCDGLLVVTLSFAKFKPTYQPVVDIGSINLCV